MEAMSLAQLVHRRLVQRYPLLPQPIALSSKVVAGSTQRTHGRTESEPGAKQDRRRRKKVNTKKKNEKNVTRPGRGDNTAEQKTDNKKRLDPMDRKPWRKGATHRPKRRSDERTKSKAGCHVTQQQKQAFLRKPKSYRSKALSQNCPAFDRGIVYDSTFFLGIFCNDGESAP